MKLDFEWNKDKRVKIIMIFGTIVAFLIMIFGWYISFTNSSGENQDYLKIKEQFMNLLK